VNFRGKVLAQTAYTCFKQNDNSSLPHVLFIVSFVDSIHLANRSNVERGNNLACHYGRFFEKIVKILSPMHSQKNSHQILNL
jgi:hypothetical protein